MFFFFKQKTVYELRISDWSSDVCSSDLQALGFLVVTDAEELEVIQHAGANDFLAADTAIELHPAHTRQIVAIKGEEQVEEHVLRGQIGRASCRERGCQYV